MSNHRLTRKPRLFRRRRLACLLALASATPVAAVDAAADATGISCSAVDAMTSVLDGAPPAGDARRINRLGLVLAGALLTAALMSRRESAAESGPGATPGA